jgi:flagellar M-ring protein FliF
MEGARDFQPVPSITFMEVLMRQSGSFVSAATILAVAVMLIWFGLRPAINTILASRATETAELAAEQGAGLLGGGAGVMSQLSSEEQPNLVSDITRKVLSAPQRRLEQIVQLDEKQAAAILKQWIRQEEAV